MPLVSPGAPNANERAGSSTLLASRKFSREAPAAAAATASETLLLLLFHLPLKQAQEAKNQELIIAQKNKHVGT